MAATPIQPPGMVAIEPGFTEDPTNGSEGCRLNVRFVAYFDILLAGFGEIMCILGLFAYVDVIQDFTSHGVMLPNGNEIYYAGAILCGIGVVCYPIGIWTSLLLLKSTQTYTPPNQGICKAVFWLCFNIFLLILAMAQIVVFIIHGTRAGYAFFMFVLRLPLFYIVFRFIQELSRLGDGAVGGDQQMTNIYMSYDDTKGEQQPYQQEQ